MNLKAAITPLADSVFRLLFPLTEPLLSTVFEKRALQEPLDRPIFIIGPERSGTSLVYSLLANHPDTFALSGMSNRFPFHPFSAVLTRNFFSCGTKEIYYSLPKTICAINGGNFTITEGINYWNRHLSRSKPENDINKFLTNADLDDETKRILPNDLKKRLYMAKKRRLLVKQPGFSLKISYLDALFPNAIFVHCLRNPFDNFRSLVEQKKKTGQPDWGIRVPEHLQLRSASLEAKTAHQLAVAYDSIEAGIARIKDAKRRYVPVRYESFQNAFEPTVRKLFGTCGLDTPAILLNHPELFVRPNPSRGTSYVTDDKQAMEILRQLNSRMNDDQTPKPARATIKSPVTA